MSQPCSTFDVFIYVLANAKIFLQKITKNIERESFYMINSKERAFHLILQVLQSFKTRSGAINWEQYDQNDMKEIKEIAAKNKVLLIMQESLKDDPQNPLGNNLEQKESVRKLYQARVEMASPLMTLFEIEGISYAVLKGAYLADTAYKEMGIRTSNDLDILIRKSDIKRVKELCAECGFVAGKSDRVNQEIVPYSRKQQVAFALNTHQIATMVKIGTNKDFDFYDTVIDFNFKLSWGEYQGNAVMSDDFLEYTKKITDSNHCSYYVLETTYNFIQLCLHAYKEANGLFFVKLNEGLCLRAFLDIYYYIIEIADERDIPLLMDILQKNQIESYIYFILKIIQDIFGIVPWCQAVIEKIQSTADKRIIEQFGLDDRKAWGGISIKERFYSDKVSDCLEQEVTEKEMKIIELATAEFY